MATKPCKTGDPAATLREFLYGGQAYDDDAVRALVENEMGAVRNSDFPVLHRALESGASAATIKAICEAHPGAVREKDYYDIALHTACYFCTPLDVIRLLFERWPEAIGEKDADGRTPLHVACSRKDGPSSEVVQFLANQRPNSLAVKDADGTTPLLLACSCRPESDELLLSLIEKCPDAVKEGDSRNWFPLHMACIHGASSRVVNVLADRFPKGLESKESHGNTPLHLACYKSHPLLENIQLLVQRCPTALAMQTNRGRTPLHLACSSNGHLEVLQLLIERRPEVLEMLDGEGRTPLQCANEPVFDPSPEAIKLLTTLHSLGNLADNDPQVVNMIHNFQEMRWPGGIALVINAFPSVANKMDHTLMPTVLSFVGRRCTLNTFYRMLQDNPMLVKGAVKKGGRSEKPSAKKKARTE